MMNKILPYTLFLCFSLLGGVAAVCQEEEARDFPDEQMENQESTPDTYYNDYDTAEYPDDLYDGSPEEEYLQSDLKNRPFDKSRWEGLVGDLDYRQKVKKAREKKPRTQNGNSPGDSQPESPRAIFKAKWLKSLAYIVLIIGGAALVAFILYRLLGFKSGPSNKRISPQDSLEKIDLEKIEQNLGETDLEKYIRLALEQNDLPLAVRLHYLAVIQILAQKQLIRWKKDKTNRHYLRETASAGFHPEFRELTLIYEATWYGNLTPDKESFGQLQVRFAALIQNIQQPLTPVAAL